MFKITFFLASGSPTTIMGNVSSFNGKN